MWSLGPGPSPRLLGRHGGPVRAVACAQAGGHLLVASASDDRTVKVWDMSTGDDTSFAMPYSVRCLAWGPASELIIGCGREIVVLERPPASGTEE
jgi:WD40 repeat protein